MKTIAIIPARGGSKRLLNKNILPLGNMPLLAHSIHYAKTNGIDTVFVSTDDPIIKRTALEHGALVIDRPDFLSGDHEPTVSALKNVLENVKDVENVEVVVLLQPTNPLRPANLLTEALQIFESGNYESLMTVSRNHQKFGTISNNHFTPYNYQIGQRSQDLEPLYFENGLLYIAKAKNILNDQIMDENGFPMIVEHPFANVDIDTQEDLDYAEYLYQKYKTK